MQQDQLFLQLKFYFGKLEKERRMRAEMEKLKMHTWMNMDIPEAFLAICAIAVFESPPVLPDESAAFNKLLAELL